MADGSVIPSDADGSSAPPARAVPTLPTSGSTVMYMVVRGPGGAPMGYPMTAMFTDDGFEFTTYRKAAKARYLRRDRRISCVFLDLGDDTPGIVVQARVRPTGPDRFEASADRAPSMHVPESVRRSVRDRLADHKRMVFAAEVASAAWVDVPGNSDVPT